VIIFRLIFIFNTYLPLNLRIVKLFYKKTYEIDELLQEENLEGFKNLLLNKFGKHQVIIRSFFNGLQNSEMNDYHISRQILKIKILNKLRHIMYIEQICQRCNGTGKELKISLPDCIKCGNTGVASCQYCFGSGDYCQYCRGTGKGPCTCSKQTANCGQCNGEGKNRVEILRFVRTELKTISDKSRSDLYEGLKTIGLKNNKNQKLKNLKLTYIHQLCLFAMENEVIKNKYAIFIKENTLFENLDNKKKDTMVYLFLRDFSLNFTERLAQNIFRLHEKCDDKKLLKKLIRKVKLSPYENDHMINEMDI
jgi:hypothetical protein